MTAGTFGSNLIIFEPNIIIFHKKNAKQNLHLCSDISTMDNLQRTMDNGQWTMDIGHWTMDKGQRANGKGQIQMTKTKKKEQREKYKLQ